LTTTQPTAHGLEGEWTTPDWPPITLDFARRVLENFTLGPALEILSVSPRPFSSASLVLTDSGPVFLKRYSTLVRAPQDLQEEHRFIDHLAANAFPVPQILRDRNNRTAIELADTNINWCCEVQSVPAGHDLYRDAISWTPFTSLAHARSAGVLLGRFHLSAQSFSAPRRSARHLVSSFTIFAAADPLTALQDFLSTRLQLAAYIANSNQTEEAFALLAPFHQKLLPLLPQLGSQWTHNDWHASNLLWLNDTAVAAIDFGLADRTTAIHDLALAIERNCIEWLSLNKLSPLPTHLDHARALIHGYASTRPFTHAEAAALVPMLALCHAEFALSEADYFLTVLNSAPKAHLAIDGYLLGHAHWFASHEGAAFLHALEEAAHDCAR
jgi:Ser/Thr protein kinase RdoA (MazF antagonist)